MKGNFARGVCQLFFFKSKRTVVAEAHIAQAMEMMRNVSKRKFPEVMETIVYCTLRNRSGTKLLQCSLTNLPQRSLTKLPHFCCGRDEWTSMSVTPSVLGMSFVFVENERQFHKSCWVTLLVKAKAPNKRIIQERTGPTFESLCHVRFCVPLPVFNNPAKQTETCLEG